jgi:DNA-directed RNA polymerase specialized sigma24 family protein
MADDSPTLTDTHLRAAILTGLTAVAELETRFRKPLERFLVGMCDRGAGRSQEKAVEIAGQVLADCFVKSPSLLERWQGGDNLEAYLRTVAANRLRSWWDSREHQRTEVNTESLALAQAAATALPANDEEAQLAETALRAGLAAATRQCPEGLVFLRLKGLHGVDQRAISRCWGHHEAQTSRRVREAMNVIRTTATEMAASNGCELSMELWQHALQRDPEILLGTTTTGSPGGTTAALLQLAAGGADAATKRDAVELMCRDSQMLEFFAQLLNRQDACEAVVVKDPALTGMAARVAECLRRSLEILQPAEVGGLITPLMAASFADALAQVDADGGTLWLLCPGAAMLEAVFNPLEPEIAGKRQPLVSGIVSLVLATGEPACVAGVPAHSRHSPAIDLALGKATHAMIAVPFTLAGSVQGVLTAVRLTPDRDFSPPETVTVARFSEVLAQLLLQQLTDRILS